MCFCFSCCQQKQFAAFLARHSYGVEHKCTCTCSILESILINTNKLITVSPLFHVIFVAVKSIRSNCVWKRHISTESFSQNCVLRTLKIPKLYTHSNLFWLNIFAEKKKRSHISHAKICAHFHVFVFVFFSVFIFFFLSFYFCE